MDKNVDILGPVNVVVLCPSLLTDIDAPHKLMIDILEDRQMFQSATKHMIKRLDGRIIDFVHKDDSTARRGRSKDTVYMELNEFKRAVHNITVRG